MRHFWADGGREPPWIGDCERPRQRPASSRSRGWVAVRPTWRQIEASVPAGSGRWRAKPCGRPLVPPGNRSDPVDMSIPTIDRAGIAREVSSPAVSVAGVTATPRTGGGTASLRRRRRWWRRRWIPVLPRQSMDEVRRSSLEQLLASLEAARGMLEAGWAQGGWWSVPRDGGQRMLVTGLAAGVSRPEPVSAVCLVGALVRAGSGPGPDAGSEVGRAIGAVYDALWESRGQRAAQPGPGLLAVSSPQVRLAQIQTLTRWNDATGRTSDEVLAILDRAIARTILSLAAVPAPRAGLSRHLG